MAVTYGPWELEAIQQQFDVFHSLTSSYSTLSTFKFIPYLSDILREHCLLDEKRISSVPEIGIEILKNLPDYKNGITCSFIVIIMNQEVVGKLMKVPVFVAVTDTERIFIDVNCSVYKTWEAFMMHNNLPASEFCFPVDGFYNFGGELNVDFGVSRAIPYAVPRTPVSDGVMLSTFRLATSFICAIPQTVLRCVKQLYSVAEQFLPRLCTEFYNIPYIQQSFDRFRYRTMQVTDFLSDIFTVFKKFFLNLKKTISDAWDTVYGKLNAICSYICKKLGKYYEQASSTSRYMFLAVTSRIDSRIKRIELRAINQLSSVNGIEQAESQESSVHAIEPAIELKTDVDLELDTTTPDYDTIQKYFQNCKLESSFFYGGKGKNIDTCFDEEPLAPATLDLLAIGHKIADHLKSENLNELQDIFESLSETVVDEYEKKINNYSQALKAARVSTGGNFNVKAFNIAFGIKGKPETHFWHEIFTSITKDHCLISKIKKTINEAQKKKDIFMMPLWKKYEDSSEGLYKIMGIQGGGQFSAKKFLTFLKDKGNIYVDEKRAQINETDSLISIRSDKFTIVVQQVIDEEKTAEGMMYIREHDH